MNPPEPNFKHPSNLHLDLALEVSSLLVFANLTFTWHTGQATTQLALHFPWTNTLGPLHTWIYWLSIGLGMLYVLTSIGVWHKNMPQTHRTAILTIRALTLGVASYLTVSISTSNNHVFLFLALASLLPIFYFALNETPQSG